MLKIGVYGMSEKGRQQLAMLQQLPDLFQITGCYNPLDTGISDCGLKSFDSREALLAESDAVFVLTDIDALSGAIAAIRKSKAVFIGQPLTEYTDSARQLLSLATEAGVHVQVHHNTHFNQAFEQALPFIHRPVFIEIYQQVMETGSGEQVIILEQMIHDLDLVLGIVPSGIRRISAQSNAIMSKHADLVTVRIEFDNGCIANLKASRLTSGDAHNVIVFQRGSCITVDLKNNRTTFLRGTAGDCPPGLPAFSGENEVNTEQHSLLEAFRTFHQAVHLEANAAPDVERAFRSMETANQIINRLKSAAVLSAGNI